MGLLFNKKILVTGLLSNKSISYGIAKSIKREGGKIAFTYINNKFKDRINKFAYEFDSNLIFQCDVTNDKEIKNLKSKINMHWHKIDGLVHSIAFAPKECISGDFFLGMTRKNFQITHDISAYSFSAIIKSIMPILSSNASLITLSYLGSNRVIKNYNIMGLAKASLESSVRYIASSLGKKGIRVNAISSGPIKTISSKGIKNFNNILNIVKNNAPIKKNITIDQIGNVSVFLLSDLSSGINAEIIYVDNGYHSITGIM